MVVGAWALGIDLPVGYCFVIMPTIILLTLLPISIAAGLPGAWMYARSGLKLA